MSRFLMFCFVCSVNRVTGFVNTFFSGLGTFIKKALARLHLLSLSFSSPFKSMRNQLTQETGFYLETGATEQ